MFHVNYLISLHYLTLLLLPLCCTTDNDCIVNKGHRVSKKFVIKNLDFHNYNFFVIIYYIGQVLGQNT